jgi:pyruvate/2-oxoglutarate dehydrogenase complex dihydrolipoamide acyltransferase (E2) component
MTLLDELNQAGVTLEAVNGKLAVSAAPGIITPALRQTLTDHKAELLATLSPVTGEMRDRLMSIADT